MADEFVKARHKDTGQVIDLAVSALGYFPDWQPVQDAADDSDAPPQAEPEPDPKTATTTRASKATDTKKGDD